MSPEIAVPHLCDHLKLFLQHAQRQLHERPLLASECIWQVVRRAGLQRKCSCRGGLVSGILLID